MNAAQASGGEDANADTRGDMGSGRHRGGTGQAETDDAAEVAHAHLEDVVVLGNELQGFVVESHSDSAPNDGDGGRDGAAFADRAFDLAGDPQVLRAGKAVAHDGRLQGDNGDAVPQSLLDLGR